MTGRSVKADKPLLQTQKNNVFRLVREHGFDPGDFRWELALSPLTPPATVDQLVHESSGYFFVFDLTRRFADFEADRASFFSPGPEQAHVADTEYGWEGQLRAVSIWLDALKREVETVSLWETFGREATRELAEANLSSRLLSKEQRKAVEVRVAQVRVYLRANIDDPARLARVEKKLDDLIDASKRLGVKDFASLSLGVLMTIAVEGALGGHQAQELVNLFFAGLRTLLGS